MVNKEIPQLPEFTSPIMYQGVEYQIGGEVHKPKDPTDKSVFLFRDNDPTHDRVVRKRDLGGGVK